MKMNRYQFDKQIAGALEGAAAGCLRGGESDALHALHAHSAGQPGAPGSSMELGSPEKRS